MKMFKKIFQSACCCAGPGQADAGGERAARGGELATPAQKIN